MYDYRSETDVTIPVLKHHHLSSLAAPVDSPSPGGEVTVDVHDINQSNLPTPFYSVLVSVSDFMALSTVFHSINSPDNSSLWLTGLKAPTN